MATFTNQAFLTYNGVTTASNIVTGEFEQELAVTKTALGTVYDNRGDITYVVSITNSGTANYTALTVTDDLAAYTSGTLQLYPLRYKAGSVKYYVNGVLQADPTVGQTVPLTITGINVPAGGNALIIYEADVTDYANPSNGATLVNTVTVSGTGVGTALTASATVTASTDPVLAITKAISPSTVTEGSTVTYTFEIQNTGNTALTDNANAVITDTFDPILTNITVTYNGTAWTAGNEYTYDQTTGVFTTTAGVISAPAATYTQSAATGIWSATPGVSTLVITGTV